MARKREIPYDLDWLRARLRRQPIRLDLPVGITYDEAASLCEAIPTDQWRAVANSWRQREHRRGGQDQRDMNRVFEELERLGSVWERLILMGCVTREDAMILAAKAMGGRKAGYCDVWAREIVKTTLADFAKRLTKANPKQREINVALARQGCEKFGITDPVELHTKTGIPLGDCMEGIKQAMDAARA